MTGLRLLVLGPPRLERDGRPVELNLRRALALLVYLAVTGRPQGRDTLAGLLWPEADDREARARLRRTLHLVAEALGAGVVLVDGDRLCLSAEADVRVDARAFERLAAAGLSSGSGVPDPEQVEHLRRAAALYADDFLAGFTLPDSVAWDEWQFLERERLRETFARVLDRLVEAQRALGAPEAAIDYARRRLALDPLHEPAHRALMELYALAGQQAAALRQYRECARILEAELGVQPEPETTALYQAIRTRRLTAPAAERLDRSPAMATTEIRYARSGDVNVAYQVVGNGPIDVVFVMGWVSHLDYLWQEPGFARFLGRLASFSRLILFDKRGTGLSDRVAGIPTLEQRMDDVRAVMDAVGSERAALVGVSEGGSMSVLFAATHPERTAALVLLGCFPKRLWAPDNAWAPTLEERQKVVDNTERGWGSTEWAARDLERRAPSAASDEQFRRWWATYLRMSASPGAAVAVLRMNDGIDIRHILPAVRVPTLVVHRAGDRVISAEASRYMAARIPGARYVELPGEDHLPFVGEQDAILDEVESFLTGLPRWPELDRVLLTLLCLEVVGAGGRAAAPGERRSREALDAFHAAARREIARFRGREVEAVDGRLLATFDGPARAIRYGCATAELAHPLGLEVRAGLHTGECEMIGDKVGGIAVGIAARMMTEAGKGEILVSRTVKDLVAGSGVLFEDLGSRAPAGIPEEWRLFRVQRGLPRQAAVSPEVEPPDNRRALPGGELARTDGHDEPLPRPGQPGDAHPDNPSHNLPVSLTTFIGRRADRRELLDLLAADRSQPRLLTLTGAGGSGKTRLALEVATDLVPAYADGVRLVDLTALRDPSLVPQALASTLGLRDEAGPALIETLARHLGQKRLLLVLDNCEHLIDACAELSDSLLRRCRYLKILATSRQALGIGGEVARPVPSLSLPDPQRAPPLEELAQYEAIQLFVDRAGWGQPDFRLTSQHAAGLTEICQRLDGMPLAIELAAARVKVLSVDQIAARLADRFRLLTVGSRTAPARQQTLRAAVEWSYDLLSRPEQVLFNRLSVFAGGWSLEGAETVCGSSELGDGSRGSQTPPPDVLDLLARLVEKSLVVARTGTNGVTRYQLLETLRRYGQERLMASGEEAAIRTCHAQFFMLLAEQAESRLSGPDQVRWLDDLDREHDNLRAALDWAAADAARAEVGLRLAAAVWRFWWLRGYLAQGRAWLERLLSLAHPASRVEVRSKALYALGVLAFRQGDYAAARSHFEQQLSISAGLPDKSRLATTLRSLGRMALDRGEFAEARARLAESLAIERKLGSGYGYAWSLGYLGLLEHFEGNNATALPLLEESLLIARQHADHFGIAVLLYYLGRVVRDQQNHELAREHLAESLGLCGTQRLLWPIPYLLEAFADLAVARAQAERGVVLAGAAARLHEMIGAPLPPVWRDDLHRRLEPARQALDGPTYAAAWAMGLSMPLELAVSYALNSVPDQRSPDSSSTAPGARA